MIESSRYGLNLTRKELKLIMTLYHKIIEKSGCFLSYVFQSYRGSKIGAFNIKSHKFANFDQFSYNGHFCFRCLFWMNSLITSSTKVIPVSFFLNSKLLCLSIASTISLCFWRLRLSSHYSWSFCCALSSFAAISVCSLTPKRQLFAESKFYTFLISWLFCFFSSNFAFCSAWLISLRPRLLSPYSG